VSVKHQCCCCRVVHYFEAFLESIIIGNGGCWLPIAATNGCGKWKCIGCCLQVISPRGRCLCAAVVVLFVCYSYIDSMNFESYYASLTIV
jgi:hypothetical protein